MEDKKPKKVRAKKYETKLKVSASFDEILIGMVSTPKKKLKSIPNNDATKGNRKRNSN